MGADIPQAKPEKPKLLWYLWDIHRAIRFMPSINDDRDHIFMAGEPLTLDYIDRYLSSEGITLNHTEVSAIMALDSILNRFTHGNS